MMLRSFLGLSKNRNSGKRSRISRIPTGYRFHPLLQLDDRIVPAVYVWDGDAGDNDFANPVNWVGDVSFPNSTDVAVFRTAGAGVVDVGTRTIGEIRFDGAGNFILQNGSVNVAIIDQQATATGSKTITAQISTTNLTGTVSGGSLDLANTTNSMSSGSTFTVNSGATLSVATDGSQVASGSSAITLNGGLLNYYAASGETSATINNPITLQASSTVQLGGALTDGASLSSISTSAGATKVLTLSTTATQPVSVTGGTLGSTINFNHVNTLRIGGLGGAGGLVQSGSGTMKLVATNTYAGSTDVLEGTLQLQPPAPVPVTTNLQAWYDASTLGLLNGQAVTTWSDLSGNGHNASVSNGNFTYVTNAVNGKPAVQIRNDGYANVTGNLFSKTQFLVFRSPTNSWENYGSAFGKQGDDRNSSYLFENGNRNFHGNQLPVAVSKNGVALSADQFSFTTIDQYMIVKIVVNDNNTSPTSYRIGGQSGWLADQDIAEMLIYNTTLSPSDESQVGSYFASKYGIASSYVYVPPANLIPDTSAVSVAGGATFNAGSTSETIGTLSGAGNLVIGGTLTVNETSSTTFSGSITLESSAVLTKSGSAALTLSGPISASGAVRLNSTSGQLNVTNTIVLANNLSVGGAGNTTISGAITTVGSTQAPMPLYTFDEITQTPRALPEGWTLTSGFLANFENRITAGNTNGDFAGDGGHPTFRVTSPQFVLNGSGDLTFFLRGGDANGRNINGTLASSLPANSINEGNPTAFQGVAVRNVATNQYVLSKGASYDNFNGTLSFTAAELAALDQSATYVVELIDYLDGGWGWVTFDDVSIPGLQTIQPVSSVIKDGAGSLTLSGANAYKGSTVVNDGSVVLGADNTLDAVSRVVVNGENAVFNTSTHAASVSGVQLIAGTITGTTGVLSSSTNYDLRAGTVSAILGGSVGVTKTNSSVVTLTGANTYTGDTVVSAGTLVQGTAGTIPSGPGFGNVVANGVVEMNGINMTVNGLSGTGQVRSTVVGPVTLSVGGNNQSSSFSGVITDAALPSLSYTGTQFDLGSGWRTASVSKSFDIDGNNVLGIDGYWVIGNNERKLTPSYITSFTKVGGVYGGNGGYRSIDDPSTTPGGSPSTITSGTMNGGPPTYFDFTLGSTLPGTIRVGVMIDGLDGTVFNPNAIFLQQIGGAGATSAVIDTDTVANYNNGVIDWLFFDIVNPVAGSVYRITGTPGNTNETTIQVVSFDSSNIGGGSGGGIVSLEKIGSGTLSISGTNTYSGTTTISAGTLQLGGSLPGTVASYSFDNASNLGADSSPNGNNLTNSGSPSYTANGYFGGGLQLNGGSSLDAAVFPTGVPTGGAAYTVSAWINPNGSNGNGGWLGWGNNGNGNQTNNFRMNGNNQILNYWWGNDFIHDVGQDLTVGDPPTGWHHVVITYDPALPSNQQVMYVDGVNVASRSASGLDAAANNFRLGVTTNGEYFNGTLDQVVILNRAITASEVQSLRNSANGGASGNPLPVTTRVILADGATFDVNGVAQTISSLSGPVGASVNLGSDTGILTFGGTDTSTFDGSITGDGSIARDSTGVQVLTGTLTHTGTTTITSGTLQVDGISTGTGLVTITDSGTLSGEGIIFADLLVGDVTTPAPQAFDGIVDPGPVGGTGTLIVGSVDFTANLFSRSTFSATLNGTAPGAFDQLQVNGTVTLGNPGANFYPNLVLTPGMSLNGGDSFMIVDNSGSSDPVIGQFSGLPQGTLFSVGGQTFSISYFGGDGNDIVVTKVNAPPPIYVNDNWAGFSNGQAVTDVDPVTPGNQPGIFGTNAFATVTSAIAAASTFGTVVVNPGVYAEAVNLNKTIILYVQQGGSEAGTVTFNSLATPVSGVSPNIQLNNNVNFIVGDATSTSVYAPINGAGSFTKAGSGTLTTYAINGYSGSTYITDNGVLRTGVAFALPGGTIDIGANARLQLGGINQSVSSLAGTGTIENASPTPATLTMGNGNVNITFQGVFADGAGGGNLSIVKMGFGVLVVSGSDDYTGDTTILNGSMRADSTNAFSPNSVFNVGPMGTLQIYGYDNTILELLGTGTVENGSTTSDATLTINSSGTPHIQPLLRDHASGVASGKRLALAKAGSGTLIYESVGTYTGGTSVLQGMLQMAPTISPPISPPFYLGTGSLSVSAGATLRLAGLDLALGGLTGAGTVENASGTPATLSVGVTANSTFSGVLQDGSGGGALSLVVDSPTSVISPGGLKHAGFSRDSGDANMFLGNNGGMLNALAGDPTALSPSTRASYKGEAILTGPLSFSNEGQLLADGAMGGLTDEYCDVWYGYLTSSEIGAWQFQRTYQDDWTGFWIDIDQDGVLESTGGGLGSNQGEQVAFNDGDVKTVNLTDPLGTGRYLVAFTHLEGGGDANVGFQFKSPSMGSLTDIEPGSPSQAGLWATFVPNTATLTLTGANTYTGSTTVQRGTLVAGSNEALGDTGSGTTVLSGGTLGFSGNVTVSEAITANGTGANGQPGAVANVSGINTYTGIITAQNITAGRLGIGSTSGTLTVGDIHLAQSTLVFNGAGNLVVGGEISGDLQGGAPPLPDSLSGLAIWLDASDIDGDGNPDALSNGAAISNWQDKSGNNRDFSTVYGNNPTYVLSSSANGQPTVNFDGSSAIGLDEGNPANNPRNFLNANGQYTLISVSRYSGGQQGRVIAPQGGQNWLFGYHDHSTRRWHYDGWGSLDVGVGQDSNQNWHLHANQMNLFNDANDPAGNFWIDGINLSPASRDTADGRDNNVPDGLELGAWAGLNEASQAQVSELIMFDRVLTDTELQIIYLYLNDKYDAFNSAALDNLPALANNVIKNGSGTVTLLGANTYSGTTTINAGMLVAGNADALGSTDAAAGTTVNIGGTLGLTGDITLAGESITIDGLGGVGQPGALVNVSGDNHIAAPTTLTTVEHTSAGQLGIGSISGNLTIDLPIDLLRSRLVFNGAGDVTVNGSISGTGTAYVTGFVHAGFSRDPGDYNMNLNNNGGMLNASPLDLTIPSPSTRPSFLGQSIYTGPIYFGDESAILADGVMGGRTDDYSNVWYSYLTTTETGNFDFQMIAQDDWTGIWVDVNQNGIFESTGGGLGSNQGEQLEFNDGGVKTVNLTNPLGTGRYLVAFTHLEGGGGANAGWQFKTPSMGGMEVVNPSAPSQAGLWQVVLPSDNQIIKNGSGKVTLAAGNTYEGATTINGGILAAAHANALGTTDVGTTVNNGGSLGFAGGITLADEPIRVNSGGALANVSGNNTIAATTTVDVSGVSNGDLFINSLAGSLTINSDLDLKLSNLTVDGSGDVIINGDIFGDGPGSLVTNPLPATYTFNSVPGNLEGWTLNSGVVSTDSGQLTAGNGGGGFAWDGGHPTFRLTSPEFKLNPVGEVSTLSFHLRGGSSRGHNLNGRFLSSLPANSQGGGGQEFQGVALRNVATGAFVLSAGAPNDAFDGIVSFSDAQLDALDHNATYVVEMIDFLDGGWGWVTFDDISIPGYTEVNTVGDNFVTKNGAGSLQLNGVNTYVGATTVADGRLQVNGSIAAASAVTVGGVGVLEGTGTVSGTTAVAGTLGAGAGMGTGKVNVQDLSFMGGGKNRIDIRGTSPGATSNGYDQIEVAGTANLANATLEVSLDGYVPTSPTFTIMTTTGGGTITGQFVGLPEGATVTAVDSAQTFIINYTSTSVTLTATVGGGPSLVSVTANGVTAGDPHPYGPHALVDAGQPSGYYTFSRIVSLDLTFDTNIGTIDPGAFVLTSGAFTLTSGAEVSTSVSGSVVTLTFNAAAGVEFGSLETGIWVLTTDLSKVQSSSNVAGTGTVVTDDGGGNGIIRRLFGDINGDGQVDSGDFGVFGATFGLNSSDPNFEAQFDVDGNGDIDSGDFGAFGARFGTGL